MLEEWFFLSNLGGTELGSILLIKKKRLSYGGQGGWYPSYLRALHAIGINCLNGIQVHSGMVKIIYRN
jgi:hypothetical protein